MSTQVPSSSSAAPTADPSAADGLSAYSRQLAEAARRGARQLASVPGAVKNDWLRRAAQRLLDEQQRILAANEEDLQRAPKFGLTTAQLDRLRISPSRLSDMAEGLRQLAALPDPVGEVIDGSVRPNGLAIQRVRVPLGVIFFIFESRPNVTVDAAGICLKSGNGVVLRGGKEAARTSQTLVDLLREEAQQCGLPAEALQWVARPERELVTHFLQLDDLIDVVIPRGGAGLVRHVSAHATMPVLKHETGNCHVYVDAAANMEQALSIVIDAKCQRPGVCNACESLLVHQDIADQLLPRLLPELHRRGVEIRGDAELAQAGTRAGVPIVPIGSDDDTMEYLDVVLSARVMPSRAAAIEHIERHGSHHTDAIVTDSVVAAREFTQQVDSSAVLVNASTRFNDGGELGLGAEIGISTDRLHARGPCGLRELTTYKTVAWGQGQTKAPVEPTNDSD